MAAYTSEEYDSAKNALSRAVGDAEYACGAQRLARAIARRQTRVYLYSFEYEIDAVTPERAFHGLDVNLLFGNNFGPPSNYVLTADDLELFCSISGYWSRFCRAR
jgi:carboxylesterase type B